MTQAAAGLPPGISVFERGWLSSNNVLLTRGDRAALVDSGYVTHAGLTCELVARALAGRPLEVLANTHLHSDHCGGNAALQRAHPGLRTLIPPGHAGAVARWDEDALTFAATGQLCERFGFNAVLEPGSELELGGFMWQVHAAPGHDPHSVVLFEPEAKVLISADALWQNGFGVIFPEFEGLSAFDEVAATLDVIESLAPGWVIPGHGLVFGAAEVPAALVRARSRLAGFVADPARHARHAAKVLLKFKLLELQQVRAADFERWALSTPYVLVAFERYFGSGDASAWIRTLVADLVESGAATTSGDLVLNA